VKVTTPGGKEVEVMIPETGKPGDRLDIFDETSHKSDSPDSMRTPTDEDLFENGHGRCLPSNRYNLTLPWAKPFADPHIYENRTQPQRIALRSPLLAPAGSAAAAALC
jgi:hypothetical protein